MDAMAVYFQRVVVTRRFQKRSEKFFETRYRSKEISTPGAHAARTLRPAWPLGRVVPGRLALPESDMTTWSYGVRVYRQRRLPAGV